MKAEGLLQGNYFTSQLCAIAGFISFRFLFRILLKMCFQLVMTMANESHYEHLELTFDI